MTTDHTDRRALPAAHRPRRVSLDRERTWSRRPVWPVCLLLVAAACDQRPEENGGPRLASLQSERLPYPPVENLPVSARAVETRAEQFVVVDGDEIVHLGARGVAATTDVSIDELLRAFWRLRGDPLGGRGAASPSAAPLLLAGAAVPVSRVIEVVAALWKHGARLAIGGGPPGSAREHPVRLLSENARTGGNAGGVLVALGPRGLELTLPGEKVRSLDECGQAPDTACLARALDTAAESGARTVFLRRAE